MQSCEINPQTTGMTVNHGGLLQVFAEDKMRFKKSLGKLGKHTWLMPARPLRGGQCEPCIGKAMRPVQWQSSFSGLALEHQVHRPIPRSRWNSSWGDLRVSLEREFNDLQSVPEKNSVSLLPDIAKGANEVIPVQHRCRVTLPAFSVMGVLHRGGLIQPM
jgi:hypothetical protein